MTIGFAEFLPVSLLINTLSEQLIKAAVAARDILNEKSFNVLANYLLSIRSILHKLDARAIDGNSCVIRGLSSLKDEVTKAEILVKKHKERSRISNLLHCRRICEEVQKSIRDIGNTLNMFELYTVQINEEVKHQLMLLESQMVHAEVRASEDMLRVLETVNMESERGRADRAVALELLERIAASQVDGQSPSYISSELQRFKRDIEEAEREKELQDVQYMQQVMALLSQADAEMALETSRKQYLELRRAVSRSRENFMTHEPYSNFKCPLTGKVMNDPVLISNGITYEREAIECELARGELRHPITGQVLQDSVLTPNRALYCTINLWRQQNYVARILKAKIKLETKVDSEQLGALADLSELCKEGANDRKWIIFESLLPLILEALKPKDIERRALCFSILMEVVKDNNYAKEQLVEANGLKQIIRCLYNNDMNLDVTRDAIDLLSELIKNKNILEQLGQQRGAILTLVTVLVRGNFPELSMDIEGILYQLSYDGNSYNEENIKAMVQFNWCKSFADCLHNGPEESKLAVTKMLTQLQLDDNRREALIQQNVIKTFVGMLKSGQLRLEHAALEALQKFSLHANSKKCIAEAGGVPLLLHFLEKPQLEMKVKSSAILADLTMEHGASFLLCDDKTPIEACKLVETIMGILSFSSLPIAENAMKVLLSLMEASDADEVPRLIQDNDNHLQTILGFIKMAQPPLRYQAMQLVFCLCRKDPSAVSFVKDDDDCLKALLHGIKHEEFEGSVQAAATGILSCIPICDSNMNRLMSTEKLLQALVKIVSGQKLEAQANALGVLVRFTDSTDIQTQRYLIQLDLVFSLKQVLTSGTAAAKIFACKSLKNISKSTARISREHHRRSFNFSRKPSTKCKLHKGKCSSKDCIVEAGVVPDIVETLKDQNPEVALAGLEALDSLLVDESMLEHGIQILRNCKAIDQLFPLIQSDSHACSEKCIDLFEVILKHTGMTDMYGKMVKMSLRALCASRVPSLQQKAVRLFRRLEEVVS